MTAREVRREIEALRKAGKKIRRSEKSARAFLVKHCFVTAGGQLAKRYRG
jgi:hypothetical protein